LDEVLSYRGAWNLRAAEENPYNAYTRLFGMNNPGGGSAAAALLAKSRKSVNDLVRQELQDFRARTDLSQSDRDRLDLHFSSIRDLEVALSCQFPDAQVSAMQTISPHVHEDPPRETVVQMQMDIIALAIACGSTRVATLQMGDGNDQSKLPIDGPPSTRMNQYHQISHRILGDGSVGAPIPNAVGMHHEIDRWHGRMLKYLLDKLNGYTVGNGTLLDSGLCVWLNDLATGQHTKTNLPYVMAGSAGGFLKTGYYIDAGNVTHNLMLNTFGAAVGVKNAAGGPLDDFGAPGLPKGLITAMLA
jgi:hypothetical protein